MQVDCETVCETLTDTSVASSLVELFGECPIVIVGTARNHDRPSSLHLAQEHLRETDRALRQIGQ